MHAQRGQVLPLLAICLTVMLGFTALAVDQGYLRYQQRLQQSAADSAAIAGAEQLVYSSSGVTTAAQADAAANGFTDNGTSTIVSVTTPPTAGPYDADTDAVDVTVQVQHPTFFAGIFGASTATVTTEAVAIYSPNGGSDCIYVLDPSSTTTVNGSNISAPSCGLIANGALTVNGASVDMSSIGANGTIRSNGATYAEASPAHALQIADPCPMITGCNYLKNNPPASSPCDYSNFLTNGGSSATLVPGIYCGSTVFNGTSTINFSSGLYVFTGSVTSNGVQNFNGSGVTFDFTSTNSFTFNGSTANLTPPTTGNYAGMLMYAPDVTSATVNGGPGTLGGVIYVPKAQLTFNGSSNDYYVLITNKLTVNGGIGVSSDNSGGGYVGKVVLAQ